jgi:hypothetical protein
MPASIAGRPRGRHEFSARAPPATYAAVVHIELKQPKAFERLRKWNAAPPDLA